MSTEPVVLVVEEESPVLLVVEEAAPVVASVMQGLPGRAGEAGAPWVLRAWPAEGEPLVGPRSLYTVTPGSPSTRLLDSTAAAGDAVAVTVADSGVNVTVQAPVGQTIKGKRSVEVGSGAGARNDSETLVYDGEGTWWQL